jgi:trk system potassium uptake protein TrkH
MSRRNTIQGFYLDGIEYNPRRIVRNIMLFTFAVEALGAALLSMVFLNAGVEDWFFMGVFHSVSAFCNAGFSPFKTGLLEFDANIPLMCVLMVLIILGGLGFLVLHDLFRYFRGKKPRLSYHSNVVLCMTGALVFGGALLFFIIERNMLYKNMNTLVAWTNALFQSVTTRTAGFEMVPQIGLAHPSRLFTCLLMLAGGAPGSIAGGIKVTTVFVIMLVMLRKPDSYGDIKVFHHRITADTIHTALTYFLKALALLAACVVALSFTERRTSFSLEAIIFEVLSAFDTVGLTLSLTPELSIGGKLVIIAAMFAGRVGLIALAFPAMRHKNYDITYPEGKVLLG